MNIWSKLMTALQGGINEAGETVVDSQALRILDQEIRDTSDALKQTKDHLAQVLAHQKVAEQKTNSIQTTIAEHEDYAVKAIDQDNEELALEIAQKIVELEQQLSLEQELVSGYKSSANNLRTALKHTETNVKRIKQQVDTVKATESVQRAQAAVAERHNGTDSKLRTAMESLERFKEKQTLRSAKVSAEKSLAEEDPDTRLQNKLINAGIIAGDKSADQILERLKNKK